MERETGLRAIQASNGVGWAAYAFGASTFPPINSEFDAWGEWVRLYECVSMSTKRPSQGLAEGLFATQATGHETGVKLSVPLRM